MFKSLEEVHEFIAKARCKRCGTTDSLIHHISRVDLWYSYQFNSTCNYCKNLRIYILNQTPNGLEFRPPDKNEN